MKTAICPMCDANVEESRYSDGMDRGGRHYSIDGLKRFLCPECASVFTDEDQARHNLVVTQIATGQEPRYLLPEQIRTWRGGIGLTQREAARLLGGGLNAFSKYETGEVTQSDAMDNLLWLVMRHPGLLSDLAKRRAIQLPQKLLDHFGHFSPTSSKSFESSPAASYTGGSAVRLMSLRHDFLEFHTTVELRQPHPSAANDQELVYREPVAA